MEPGHVLDRFCEINNSVCVCVCVLGADAVLLAVSRGGACAWGADNESRGNAWHVQPSSDCERHKYSQTCWENHSCLSHTLQNQRPNTDKTSSPRIHRECYYTFTLYEKMWRCVSVMCLSFCYSVIVLSPELWHESFYKSKTQNAMQTADNGVCQKQQL